MRARNIKPGFFDNELLAECSPHARLLFVGLWCYADREGRFEYRPKKIKAKIFPYENLEIESLMAELSDRGFIDLYPANGAKFGQVNNFPKHQSPHPKEKSCDYPEKPCNSTARQDLFTASPKKVGTGPADILIPDSLKPDTLIEKDSCSEPGPQKPDSKPAEVFIELPLVDGSFFAVDMAYVHARAEAFPAVDIRQQLRQMKAWLEDNPANRKTRRGIKAFITRWLSKEQDRAPKIPGAKPLSQKKTVDLGNCSNCGKPLGSSLYCKNCSTQNERASPADPGLDRETAMTEEEFEREYGGSSHFVDKAVDQVADSMPGVK